MDLTIVVVVPAWDFIAYRLFRSPAPGRSLLAILGIGILKGAKGINYGVLGEIAMVWLATPIFAGILTSIALFFAQNVFNLQVSLQH